MNANDVIYSHFDIPIPGSDKSGGATVAVYVEKGLAIVGLALRSPLDQLWRKKGRNIAFGRLQNGYGRFFVFGVADGARRGEILNEARRLVMQTVRWQDYPFNRWINL